MVIGPEFARQREICAEIGTMLDAIEELQVATSLAQLRSIEARNPGINIDSVRGIRKHAWDFHPDVLSFYPDTTHGK